jgi:hypothetical protein
MNKTDPDSTKRLGWSDLLAYFRHDEARQIDVQALAREIEKNTALQSELALVKEALRVSQEKCTALAVPHDEIARVKAENRSLQSECDRATVTVAQMTTALKSAQTGETIAVASQHAAEQGEKQAKQYVTDEFKKVTDRLASAANAVKSSLPSWVPLNALMDELRRMHAEAIARPVPFAPTPVKPVPVPLSAEVLAKRQEEFIQQAAIRNKQEQGRSQDPSMYESVMHEATPRRPDPEPRKQISGGADWSDWV